MYLNIMAASALALFPTFPVSPSPYKFTSDSGSVVATVPVWHIYFFASASLSAFQASPCFPLPITAHFMYMLLPLILSLIRLFCGEAECFPRGGLQHCPFLSLYSTASNSSCQCSSLPQQISFFLF